MQWLAVAIGGALGAMGRYAITVYTLPPEPNRFPMGTFTVNVLGSLLIGIFYVLILERGLIALEARNWIMAGFLGAFTTFSTFSLEAVALWQGGQGGVALLYVVASLFACILAAAAGIELSLKLF